MATDQSVEGFFDRATTKKFVTEFRNGDKYTIFVGAGASVDRGSPSWEGLVRLLLADSLRASLGPDAEAIAELSAQSLDPATLGSVVQRRFEKTYPHIPVHHLHNQIFHHLYARWTPRASLSTHVADLALQLRRLGNDVHIITTNYDDNIEMSHVTGEATVPDVTFKKLAGPPGHLETNEVPVVHMNGMIGHNQEILGEIVFSESDFSKIATDGHRWSELSTYLADRFENTTVLFVGTSLRDINVSSALVRTIGPQNRRYVLTSIHEFEGLDRPRRKDIAAIHDHRYQHLGVQSIRTDFFGQVGQLTKELTYSVALGDAYEQSCYSTRLRDWWDAWSTDMAANSHLVFQRRSQHQTHLAEFIERLQADFAIPATCRMKVELWVRSSPDLRRLELWSSSDAVTVNLDGPHSADIELDSAYICVSAFTKRQIYMREQENLNRTRWAYRIAATVVLSSERWLSLPAGVIVLLLDDANVGRGLTEDGGDDSIGAKLLDVGEHLLSPDQAS